MKLTKKENRYFIRYMAALERAEREETDQDRQEMIDSANDQFRPLFTELAQTNEIDIDPWSWYWYDIHR